MYPMVFEVGNHDTFLVYAAASNKLPAKLKKAK